MSRFRIPSSLYALSGKTLPWMMALAGILLVSLFCDSFGVAWDDYLQAQHGENCLDFYLSGGKNRAFLELENMYLYGGLFEILSAGIHRILDESDMFRYRALLCGLTALLAVGLTIKVTGFSASRTMAWFAGLFLLSSIQFWGQAFINSKDVPFTAAYVFWWYCYIQWFKHGFQQDRWLAFSGLSLGLVLGIRIGGIPLVGFTVCAGIAGWILQGREEKQSWAKTIGSFPLLEHLAVLIAGWSIMILFWPYALLRPLYNPFEAFFTFAAFPWSVYVSFMGVTGFSDTLPRYAFMLEHFLAQPLWCYPLYAAGIYAILRKWRSRDTFQRFQCMAIAFWILPLFLIYFAKPFSFYNGVRQSLFLWPAYAWLAALGLQEIHYRIRNLAHPFRWIFAVGVAILLMNVFLATARHPFAYTYRNPVVRLLPGGINGFDSDYHALSFRTAAEYIDRISMERLVAGEPSPTVLVVSSNYGATSYSRFEKFSSRRLFSFDLQNDEHVLQFEYVVILNNLTKKTWMFHQFKLQECEIADTIETDGQVHTVIYRRPNVLISDR